MLGCRKEVPVLPQVCETNVKLDLHDMNVPTGSSLGKRERYLH